jgi:hypothetical protein
MKYKPVDTKKDRLFPECTTQSITPAMQSVTLTLVLHYPSRLLLLILTRCSNILALLRFQHGSQILVHCKRYSLSWRNSHHSWRDTLVERPHSLGLPHISRNVDNTTHGRVTRLCWALLQTSLDGVDWCIGERTHCTRGETDKRGLPRWNVRSTMVVLEFGTKVGVRGEVGWRITLDLKTCRR